MTNKTQINTMHLDLSLTRGTDMRKFFWLDTAADVAVLSHSLKLLLKPFSLFLPSLSYLSPSTTLEAAQILLSLLLQTANIYIGDL